MHRDWEKIKKYYEAWWNCEVLDKVLLRVTAYQAEETALGSIEDRFNKEKVIAHAERKIQAKKKAIIVYCQPDEVDFVLENLAPEGLLIATNCSSVEEARRLLLKKRKYRGKYK